MCSETYKADPSEAARIWLDGFRNLERVGVPKDAGVLGSGVLDLGRMHTLLEHLKSPQKDIPNVIHVVGTKGKGSVTSLLVSMLTQAGETVGSYSSPHVLSFFERITLPGSVPISATAFAALVSRNRDAVDAAHAAVGGTLTFFEVLTALALRALADSGARWAVMEAGLGGATDATNVFEPEQVKACVLTAVECDHLEALGGSLQSVAAAKAGILKPGCLAVIARQPLPAADAVLTQHAAGLGCAVVRGESVSVHSLGVIVQGQALRERVQLICPPDGIVRRAVASLVGAHQRDNIAAAVAAAHALNKRGACAVDDDAIVAGLFAATLPGRFQTSVLHVGPQATCWLVLDCAHTALSMRALAATLTQAFLGGPCVVVLALAADKDLTAIAAEVAAARPACVLCTSVPIAGSSDRALSATAAEAAVKGALARLDAPDAAAGHAVPAVQPRTDVVSVDSMRSALGVALTYVRQEPPTVTQHAREHSPSRRQPVLCVTGSTYAVRAAHDAISSMGIAVAAR